MVTNLEEMKNLPLGTKIYLPNETNIRWWYYAVSILAQMCP